MTAIPWRDGVWSVEVIVRYHGKRMTQDYSSPLVKQWPVGTRVTFAWGVSRDSGTVFGWTRTRVVVARDGWPYRYLAEPHMLTLAGLTTEPPE